MSHFGFQVLLVTLGKMRWVAAAAQLAESSDGVFQKGQTVRQARQARPNQGGEKVKVQFSKASDSSSV